MTKFIKSYAFFPTLIFIVLCWIMGVFTWVVYDFNQEYNQPPAAIKKIDDDRPFTLQDNGYSGWQMGCNYALGSSGDWDEEKQKYGDQKFLTCANGILYEKISK